MRKILIFVLILGMAGAAATGCKSGKRTGNRAITPRERRAMERAVALRQQAGQDDAAMAKMKKNNIQRIESETQDKAERDKVIARANAREAKIAAREAEIAAAAQEKMDAENKASEAVNADKIAKSDPPKVEPIKVKPIEIKPEIKKPDVKPPVKPLIKSKPDIRPGGFDTPNDVVKGGSVVKDIEGMLGVGADRDAGNKDGGVRKLKYDYFERFDAMVYTDGVKNVDVDRVNENYWEAMTKPWTRRSKPYISDWLNGNRSFIEGFKEASRRTVLVGGGRLRVENMAGLRIMGELGLVSRVLASDAYFFIGRGNWRRAQGSIDAMKRIGRLMMKEHDFVVSERGESFLKQAIEIELSMNAYKERNE